VPVGELERLRTLTGQLQTALDSRVVIEQAKGILAERYTLPMEAAFELLRGTARSTRTNIHELAAEVVASVLSGNDPIQRKPSHDRDG
jgi:AmiR/NasT family two-component response regulator